MKNYIVVALLGALCIFFVIYQFLIPLDSVEFNKVRSAFELLYFVSGVSLAISGIIALKQIIIAKNDICTRSTREAATLTATQCQLYGKDIIIQQNNINDEMKKLGILPFDKETAFSLDNDEIIQWLNKYGKELLQSSDKGIDAFIYGEIINLLNSFEGWSIYFINGICDEKIAYPPLSKTFCKGVKDFCPIIALLRKDDNMKYSNIIRLYDIWSKRRQKQQIENQASKALEEFYSMKQSAAGIEDIIIKPIGTEK